jgi:hypothetical protein
MLIWLLLILLIKPVNLCCLHNAYRIPVIDISKSSEWLAVRQSFVLFPQHGRNFSTFLSFLLSPIGFIGTIFVGFCCCNFIGLGISAAGFVAVGVEVGKFV